MKRMVAMMLCMLVLAAPAFADDLETWYEKSGYLETPRYDETVAYAKQLAESSRWIHYTTYGVSPQGRDLPLLIVDKDRTFDPQRVARGRKAIILITAGIHAGESDGKDAGFMLVRDIAARKVYPNLLNNTTILFQPIFNVDGHERFGPFNRINQNGPAEMGYRVTAQRYNLNRDFLKVDAPEMRAWIELYNAWEPDFIIDCHVTDGADYQYVMTHILETEGNMAPSLTTWTRDEYLATMNVRMADSGFPMFPYVYPKVWPDPASGLRGATSGPRFSTGYGVIRNRPTLLTETHMLKDYKTRVTATYELLRHTIEYLNVDYRSLHTAIAEAERLTASRHFREMPFAVEFELDEEPVKVEFAGFEYSSEVSDLTGGPWYKFTDKKKTFEFDFFHKHPSILVDVPEAYIIPPEWTDVIDRVELHAVETTRLSEDYTTTVSSYRFSNVQWAPTPFEGRHTLTFETEIIEETRTFPKGSVVVNMAQKNARVAAHILEPQAPDSFVLWGFFDGIFEQKEYGESYFMEPLAREMMEKDPDLRRRFEEMRENTPGFKDDPRWQLNWFYQQSPYWDDRINVYPIGKVLEWEAAQALPTE